jgi:L-fucose mutarotase/ribose pyranase (RbsD/FucU family)
MLVSTLALALIAPSWRDVLKQDLPLLGHRNWICVVDAAYPAQTSPGIKMIDTGTDHATVVNAVLKALSGTKHVRPAIYMDNELKFVAEADAKGITALRKLLDTAVQGKNPIRMPHEDIIAKLDKAGSTFQILMLKTNCVLPYTSVFMELGCGYWSDGAEKRMRAKIGG